MAFRIRRGFTSSGSQDGRDCVCHRTFRIRNPLTFEKSGIRSGLCKKGFTNRDPTEFITPTMTRHQDPVVQFGAGHANLLYSNWLETTRFTRRRLTISCRSREGRTLSAFLNLGECLLRARLDRLKIMKKDTKIVLITHENNPLF